MNVMRVPYEIREELKRVPEYSMGVQRVFVKLASGIYRNGWIINGRFFLSDDDKLEAERDSNKFTLFRLAVLSSMAEEGLRKPVDKQSFLTIVTITPRSAESMRGVRKVSQAQLSESKLHTFANDRASLEAKSGAAKDAPMTRTQADEIFKRFSAYKTTFVSRPGAD